MPTGRPVKWTEDREENFVASYQGRGMEAEVELAFDADATHARGARADLGGPRRLSDADDGHPHPYDRDADVRRLRRPGGRRGGRRPTDEQGADRPIPGRGAPEAAYFVECTMDIAARELGVDPLELRRRNLIREFPYRTALGWTYDSGDYARCLDRVGGAGEAGAAIDEGDRRWARASACTSSVPAGCSRPRRRSCMPTAGSWCGAARRRTARGTTRRSRRWRPSGSESGLEDVELRFGDSTEVPRGVGTFASRSVAMGGSAVVQAVDALKEKCDAVAERLEEAPPFATWRRPSRG